MNRDAAPRSPAETVEPDIPDSGLIWVTAGLAGMATAAVALFLVLYGHLGAGLVASLDRSSGDALLEEGARLEAGLQIPEAIAVYREALGRPFSRPETRIDTLVRLGGLVLWHEDPASALACLEEARDSGVLSARVCEPLCHALLQLGRAKDAAACARDWHERARVAGLASEQALAKFYEGRAMQNLGETRAALDAFLEANALQPGGEAAYYAGVLSYDLGAFGQAQELLEAFSRRGTGEKAAWARKLCRRIQEAEE